MSSGRQSSPSHAAMNTSCAGNFVIALQLLAWCAVGGLLLQRGLGNIREVGGVKVNETTSLGGERSQEETPGGGRRQEETMGGERRQEVTPGGGRRQEETSGGGRRQEETPGGERRQEETAGGGRREEETLGGERRQEETLNATRTTTPHKRKYDVTASSVVMAALGAAMLVVGPSVVILRCCDTKQGLVFDKIPVDPELNLADLDLPPDYDEVSGRAPRYSLLFPDQDEGQ